MSCEYVMLNFKCIWIEIWPINWFLLAFWKSYVSFEIYYIVTVLRNWKMMLTDAMNKITMKNSKQRSFEIKRHPTSNSSKIVYDRKIFLGAYSLRHEKKNKWHCFTNWPPTFLLCQQITFHSAINIVMRSIFDTTYKI